jgi:hypothetical protein
LIYNKCVKVEKKKDKKMSKMEKLECESDDTEEKILENIKKILSSPIYKDKKIITSNQEVKKYLEERRKVKIIDVDFEEMVNFLEYGQNEKNYCLNFEDSLCRNIVVLSYVFNNFKFSC